MKILSVILIILVLVGIVFSESRESYEKRLKRKRIGIALLSVGISIGGLAIGSFFAAAVLQQLGGDVISQYFYYGTLGGLGLSCFFWPFGIYHTIKNRKYSKAGLEEYSKSSYDKLSYRKLFLFSFKF